MKKIILFSLIFSAFSLFAEGFKISTVNYDITASGPKFFGVTKKYAIEKNVPVDKNTVFKTKEELESYILDYTIQLNNTRNFETIEISYDVDDDKNVTLNVSVKDTFHMIAVPYLKYDSNSGLILKLKLKDSNFLGTMNTLSTELNFALEQKKESDNPDYKFGFEFDYNYPFQAGIFKGIWLNDYSLSYTIGDSSPEWNLKTGLEFELPKNNYSYILTFTQAFANNFDYNYYNDQMYFTEDIKFSLPIELFSINNFGTAKYTPYVEGIINWDFNGIDDNNTSLSSPILAIGHSLSLGRANWSDNYRDGFTVNLKNYFDYNFQRQFLYPVISLDSKLFKSFTLYDGNWFNKIGLSSRLYSFVYAMDYSKDPYFMNDGTTMGNHLRGIRDEQHYSTLPNVKACKVPSAICLNFDMPFRIVKTHFEKSFFKYLNFDLQLSPFVDIGLTYNKSTKNWFDPKDGFYTTGLEVLVYPQKLSSFTIRGSIGVDAGRLLLKNYLNMDWRKNVSIYEIFFGIGLHY